ncbi:sulfonate ABC transporter substrate-binding protein [Pseudoclavibacter endophyticus]|uniref:ABC transporter substrate-binding protein n=1 Tax=Pseudoclavibacter endophyticus TaxID=1778590 RepID=A0A6H9WLF4_9MICO|nr:ABC transporter substrate-binding protein [Pseudoclavibacter endophyticus]KAB1646742.1 ABC transporter substrate-binding protein [Pseudoclavibacter endophyticus]GGA75954.1 sulfonate ABC transporter substrate-binding protein [Pseudoclavibacter endophyticus]
MPSSIRTHSAIAAAGVIAALLAGCAPAAAADGGGNDGGPISELRLGYFANATHAPALVGLHGGHFDAALGDLELTAHAFGAGPAAIEALSAGAIDVAYVGPNPAINTFIQSGGESVRIIAGAASGGAALVVREGIESPADLAGTIIASPQLGNTQDVALREWLADQGFETDLSGRGDVRVTPTANAQAFRLIQQGDLDGAWMPEPWASRLVLEGGAHVLVDEAELWDDGAFPTTLLVVRQGFLDAHPEAVKALLEGHLAAVQWIARNPAAAAVAINDAIAAETGAPLGDAVIDRALSHVDFTVDPLAAAFPALIEAGVRQGTQREGSIDGLFDLGPLNDLLATRSQARVSDAGLGAE